MKNGQASPAGDAGAETIRNPQSEIRNPEGPILFFDGVCNLCNGAVDFIVRRDRRGVFRFAPLQSAFAQNALAEAGFYSKERPFSQKNMDTMVLLDGGQLFQKSAAALRIGRRLGGFWAAVSFLGQLVPRPLADALYDLVARNRYRLFGKKETCRLPTEAERGRFLG